VDRINKLSQSEFDQLATYVAVAEELRAEPFMSEDNQERLINSPESDPSRFFAHFCHPAFLKSAVAPFRKLWLQSEPCAYERVRELVFRANTSEPALALHVHFFTKIYSTKLNSPPDIRWSEDSAREIINLWLYTQAVHAGPKEFPDGRRKDRKRNHYELKDFDKKAQEIGREKFEFLFRVSIRTIGSFYTEFLEKLAYPLFHSLVRQSMKPGFEAAAALKYNPYPDRRYNITFDDVFWHLDKEAMEETFDRLLARRRYQILHTLFSGFFKNRAEALAAVCENESFHELLERNKAVILHEGPSAEDQSHIMCMGPFEVYRNKKIRFLTTTEAEFVEAYEDFRECLFEERKRQRKPTWRNW
jgi:hypothetical protein